MNELTHLTEYGLVNCLLGLKSRASIGSRLIFYYKVADLGFGADKTACGSESVYLEDDGTMFVFRVIGQFDVFDSVPTCPKCAVLRDEALEGKIKGRKSESSSLD